MSVVIVGTKTPLTAPMPTGMTWAGIRSEFIRENLDSHRFTAFTLKDLSIRYGLNYGHLRNVASKEKWSEELKRQKEAVALSAAAAIREVSAVSEIEVRTRQAGVARIVIDKALTKLIEVDPRLLSVKEATEMLKLGLQEERKALGLMDKTEHVIRPMGEEERKKNELTTAISQVMALLQQPRSAA